MKNAALIRVWIWRINLKMWHQILLERHLVVGLEKNSKQANKMTSEFPWVSISVKEILNTISQLFQ